MVMVGYENPRTSQAGTHRLVGFGRDGDAQALHRKSGLARGPQPRIFLQDRAAIPVIFQITPYFRILHLKGHVVQALADGG